MHPDGNTVNDRGPGPDGEPYAWMHKATLWKIRNGFDDTSYLDQALAVYTVLCELASDAHASSFMAVRRKIAERAGVSVRRVSEIHLRFRALMILDWKQQQIEGTLELGANLYTLLRPGIPCTTLSRDGNSENCTVVKESACKNFSKVNVVKKAGLTNLTASKASMKRIAREIGENKHAWYYDNCKVRQGDISVPSLASVLEKSAVGLSEKAIQECWQEAVTRTHSATVDQLGVKSSIGYCIACLREQLDGYKKYNYDNATRKG